MLHTTTHVDPCTLSTVWCESETHPPAFTALTPETGRKACSWVEFFDFLLVLGCEAPMPITCTALWSLGCVSALATESASGFETRAFFRGLRTRRSLCPIVSSGNGHPHCMYG